MNSSATRSRAPVLALVGVALATLASAPRLGAQTSSPGADGAVASSPADLTGTYRATDGRLLIVWDLVDQMPGGEHQLAAFEPTSGWLRTLHREAGDRFGFGPGWFAPSPREGTITFRPNDGIVRRVGSDGTLEAARAPIRRRDVSFGSGDVVLAGELVLPPAGRVDAPYPGLVMIPGFGRLTRKTPRIVADQFALAGLAVLIHDRRGTGASSGEYVPGAIFDYARDAEAALAYLRDRPEVDPERIGVMASSLGGLVAPLLHDRDPRWAFFVCRVCPATPAWEQKVVSILGRGRSAGLDNADLLDALARKILTARYALTREDYGALRAVEGSTSGEAWRREVGDPEDWRPLAEPDAGSWDVYRSVLEVDPGAMLRELDVPALLILGERDRRLPGDYHAMRARRIFDRSDRPHQEVRVLPGASHGLMEVRTDSGGRRLPFDRFVPGWHDRMVRWVTTRVGAGG